MIDKIKFYNATKQLFLSKGKPTPDKEMVTTWYELLKNENENMLLGAMKALAIEHTPYGLQVGMIIDKLHPKNSLVLKADDILESVREHISKYQQLPIKYFEVISHTDYNSLVDNKGNVDNPFHINEIRKRILLRLEKLEEEKQWDNKTIETDSIKSILKIK